ncbi:glutamate 5-kinase [Myxococcus xanthus DK 1622]|uniref:Glutamate 5-kinase n=1 Tax=Myxococcus xanthus (strain DK1622) TaxID=246197 RepID=PROB_MYXXD|nr:MULTISPECIES: glutamate 5-kinase [Myxococcus]Q1DCK9.1 RecName: Full=Glutamate 5-kinase; AltName: Full=Gamma-glutamyl kinase; Short=GK [Myxococcus xanthus DK 1622]ABF87554.1 glutamate 5-kinase [Myxococcus xanthus DK 1622]NOJ55266.1 glutamate 5-kinase [Myxococcus xanthus]QPM80998.1 glutamate 5-kinase [Myxococcus xanthus]QVW70057.1 glutamate 5-kinase [Myxococcus xanthus DZ2]UEO03813.1 glutamate 5-kinase [Myxococcus xanthus DZ2]
MSSISTGRTALRSARRVVVKIGTNALTNATGRFNRQHFDALGQDLLWAAQGRELVVVSSGAIALGVERLGLPSRPRDIPGKQACAAVGQSRLVQAYEEAFAAHGKAVAQVLLTHEDVQERRRYLNVKHTLERLLTAGVVPVINENDTVSVDELKFGDNDTLAGLVAGVVDADALVLLSDVEGLYTGDPRRDAGAELLATVMQVTPEVLALATGTSSGVGTGGMSTKVRAAARASDSGIHCVITSGAVPGRLRAVLEGADVGTHFEPTGSRRSARAAWIAHALRARGTLTVDAGAREAIVTGKRSLLPSGVRGVEGDFGRGDPVDLVDAEGAVFARGLAAYDANELRRIAGHRTADIEAVLGYRYLDEAVHRDDLAVL